MLWLCEYLFCLQRAALINSCAELLNLRIFFWSPESALGNSKSKWRFEQIRIVTLKRNQSCIMKRRVESTENVLPNGEKASWRVTVLPRFPVIVQIYPCYSSIIFNTTHFTCNSISVFAAKHRTTLPVRYIITAFCCLKDGQMEKAYIYICINQGQE